MDFFGQVFPVGSAVAGGVLVEVVPLVLSVGGTVFVGVLDTSGVSPVKVFLGSWCSARKGISRPLITSAFFCKSMHAWNRFSISRPKSMSTLRPCNTVNKSNTYLEHCK